MVDFRPLDDRMAFTGQLQPEDFPELAARGVRTIINNRPDGEEPGQLPAAEAAALAARLGMAYHYLPVTMPTLTRDQISAFGRLLDQAEAPVVAHCRTGTRSAGLWAAAQAAAGRDLEQAMTEAERAGFDLASCRPPAARALDTSQ